VGGQRHDPAALPPGNSRYPFYRRLGGSQGRSGQVRKISLPTGIRSPDRPARSESLYRLSYPGPSGIFVYVTQRDGPHQVTTQYKAHFPGSTKENNLEAPVQESRSAFFEPVEFPITRRIVHHRNGMFDRKQPCNFVAVVLPEVL
jgi:hypothetical protein